MDDREHFAIEGKRKPVRTLVIPSAVIDPVAKPLTRLKVAGRIKVGKRRSLQGARCLYSGKHREGAELAAFRPVHAACLRLY